VHQVMLLNQQHPTIDAGDQATARRAGPGGPWKTNVVVSQAHVMIPEDKGRNLDPVGPPKDVYFAGDTRNRRPEPLKVPRPGPDQPLAEPFLVTAVQIKRVEIQSAEVRASVAGKLNASVSVDGVRVVGAIEAPRGVLTLFNRRYQVEQASVRFDGPTDPRLDIRLTHTFPEMTIYVEVSGRASQPKVALRSDPPTYTQGELLGVLLGGNPGEAPKSFGEATAGVASSFISRQVVDYVGQYLPIDFDVLTIEGPTSGSGAGASLTVGKWINRSLFLAYRQRVEARPDQNAGEAELEYWLRPRLVVEGVAGDRGIDGLDLLWTRRW
jgi:autotransporter translocation and assembly factor TamB